MKKVIYIKLTFLFMILTVFNAQAQIPDSLRNLYSDKSNHDTLRWMGLNELVWHYLYSSHDSAFRYAEKAMDFALKKNLKKQIAKSYNAYGVYYYVNDDADKAIENFNNGAKVYKELGNEKGENDMYNNMGAVYQELDNYDMALKYYEKGYKAYRRLKMKKYEAIALDNIGNVYQVKAEYTKALSYKHRALKILINEEKDVYLANVYGNIGLLYSNLQDYKLTIEYSLKSGEIYESMNDLFHLAAIKIQLGLAYKGLKQFDKAIQMQREAYELYDSLDNKSGMAITQMNIGNYYFDQQDYKKAVEYHLNSLKLKQEINDSIGIAVALTGLGRNYIKLKDFKKAEESCKEAYNIAGGHKNPLELKSACECLYLNYAEQKDSMNAFRYFREFILLKDSLNNEDQTREVARMESKYEYSIKASADSLKNAEEQRRKNLEIDKQKAIAAKERFQTYALMFAVAGVLIFSLFLYNRFKLIKKQKHIIEEQKYLVDEKQKEIISSINYAQRLQKAILAPESEIKKYLPKSFLFYLPKDIVAGDFYFFEKTDSHIFYAAADCTGHGVPGAMVSIVCSNALTRCVKEFGLTDPGKILDKTRELILETFKKSGADVKDGMDISLVALALRAEEQSLGEKGNSSLSHSALTLKWAGANNPLWYIENGEMKEIKADKQPIGKTDHPKPFTTHSLAFLSHDSCLFLFTDGYPDQFGGPKGKKFKYATLKKLLQDNYTLDGDIMKGKLNFELNSWKGDIEQVDDICIIGINLN